MLRWFFAARPALRSVSTGQRKHLLVSRTSTKHTIASRPYGTSSGRGNTHAEFQDEVSGARDLGITQGHLPLSDNQRRTIYALSTPPGKGGVAVVRISGPDALQIWEAMVDRGITPGRGSHPAPWHMYRCKITHPSSGEVLDDGLAVYFKGSSFYGRPWLSSRAVFYSTEVFYHGGRRGVAHPLWSSRRIFSALGVVLRPHLSAC